MFLFFIYMIILYCFFIMAHFKYNFSPMNLYVAINGWVGQLECYY